MKQADDVSVQLENSQRSRCGHGSTRLLQLHEQGWRNIFGIEMVPAVAEHARGLGFRVEDGMVEDALDAFPDGFLDAVVSSMVLEHLHDTFSVVRKIAAKLKPDGQFLFSTIVRDSLDARIYGRYWAGFDFPRHMVYFTARDLRAMLAHKFELLKIVHQCALVDFLRSSGWRVAAGEGHSIDKLILAADASIVAGLLNWLLALAGLTMRVSVRCRAKSQ